MAWYAWKRSGLPRTQVLGTGTALDTSRLKTIIGEETGLGSAQRRRFRDGRARRFAVHRMVDRLARRQAVHAIPERQRDRFSSVSTHEIEEKTRTRGNEIVAAKGGTNFGIASTVAGIVQTILWDERRIVPVSTCSTANTASATCSSACRPSCVPTAPTRLSSWNLPMTSSPNCIIPRSWSAPTAKGCCSRRPA